MAEAVYTLQTGHAPLLISMPHVGTALPADLVERMLPSAREVPDTDWFVDRLYAFAAARGVSLLRPHFSRYLIDLNRAPDSKPLYPGASNTELCPTSRFDDAALYAAGQQPDAQEIDRRRVQYWQPYHDALSVELQRLKALHGYALLLDAHSIASQVPRFFEGRLPDLNYGTADGASCAPALQDAVWAIDTGAYSKVMNGRFKGGYITRHYGQPGQGMHALQLELSQRTYMDETTRVWREESAQRIMPVLARVVETLLAFKPV